LSKSKKKSFNKKGLLFQPINRQADRQVYRYQQTMIGQPNKRKDTQTNKQKNTKTNKQTNTKTNEQTNRHTNNLTQTNTKTSKQKTQRQTNKKTQRQTNKQTQRQTNKNTCGTSELIEGFSKCKKMQKITHCS
jgi:hypothetical protein